MLLQQGAGLAVVLFGIVLAFTHPHHLHQRKLLLEQVQKTGLALFVGAVTQRAHDHRHTGLATVGQRAHEAGDQVRSGAARGPVVQSHIGNAARVGQVGNQRDGGHTLLCQLGHRLTHHGVLQRHKCNAVAAFAVVQQRLGQRLGVEAFDVGGLATHVERGPMVLRVANHVAQHMQKAVAALGDQNHQAQRLGLRCGV